MALVFHALHPAPASDKLNEEWFVLENTGPGLLHSAGWSLEVGKRGARPRGLGALQPGFALAAGAKIRLVTGTASKKSQGTPPAAEEKLPNYHLFLREPILKEAGLIVHMKLKQHTLATAVFDPAAPSGVAAPTA